MFDTKDGQFEDRKIQQSFVLPGTNTVAGTRGFGVVFIDVELNNSSSIEYFGKDANNNKVTLGKYYVKPSANGEAQFLGVVYDEAVITEVEVTVGSKALFSFDGKNLKAFGAENLNQSIDLAVTDDFFYAVPETIAVSSDQLSATNCLFDWAERNYATYVYPAGASTLNYQQYTYRYYQGINTYLGVSSENNTCTIGRPMRDYWILANSVPGLPNPSVDNFTGITPTLILGASGLLRTRT